MRKKPRIPEVVFPPVTFHAKPDHVVAVFYINGSTIGLRFHSPEEMLMFFTELMQAAALVWPDNEWVREYQSE